MSVYNTPHCETDHTITTKARRSYSASRRRHPSVRTQTSEVALPCSTDCSTHHNWDEYRRPLSIVRSGHQVPHHTDSASRSCVKSSRSLLKREFVASTYGRVADLNAAQLPRLRVFSIVCQNVSNRDCGVIGFSAQGRVQISVNIVQGGEVFRR